MIHGWSGIEVPSLVDIRIDGRFTTPGRWRRVAADRRELAGVMVEAVAQPTRLSRSTAHCRRWRADMALAYKSGSSTSRGGGRASRLKF